MTDATRLVAAFGEPATLRRRPQVRSRRARRPHMHDLTGVRVDPATGATTMTTRCGLSIPYARAESFPDVLDAFTVADGFDWWDDVARRRELSQRERLRWCGHCHARREPRIVTVPADPAFV